MKDCPHRTPAGKGCVCAVLVPLGVKHLGNPSKPHSVCGECESQWIDGIPPTPGVKTTYTPAINRFGPPPSARERIASALAALRRFVSSGGKLLSAEAEKARRAVCDGCEFKDGKWCTRCGCFLWAKRRLPEEHCPLAKWAGDPPGGCGRC